jgi:hydrogenase-4 component B
MMTPEQAVLASILICIAGALLTLVVSRNKTAVGWLAFLATGATAILIFFAAARVLRSGPSPAVAEFWSVPALGFSLRLHVDGLSVFFLILAAFIAVLAALYSIAYMRHYREYSVARYYPNFLLFLGGMYGLLSTTDMMGVFFLFWQLMVLPSYMLMRFEPKNKENLQAANKYLVIMQIACIAIMLGAFILGTPVQGTSGSLKYDFDTVSANLPVLLMLRPDATALAFALFLAGFGIAMGMWPFGQLWLPDAEPACPSPASALLSGVMLKVGVYGLLRHFLWLVPLGAQADYPLAKWGLVVVVLGTISLFTGTMQALKQEQSERLLAFHSIGQIGYILLGTGTCMALLSAGPVAATLATIALMGALFHVLNHGLFKGLLFLNAGSMLHATGTQDLNQMGGLMKFMPLTAITALVASFSISGVPLFNGFVSKWTIYVAAIQGNPSAKYLAVCAVIALLTSVLTLASFIKFFGVSFLTRPSALVKSQAEERGRLEVPWLMQVPQLMLAFLCLLLGVLPGIGVGLIQRALQASPGGLGAKWGRAVPAIRGPWMGVGETHSTALFAPLALAAVLGLMFLLAYGISKLGSAPRRTAVPWLCGYVREKECYRYTAHNFYGEIKRYFRWVGGAPRAHAHKPAVMKS